MPVTYVMRLPGNLMEWISNPLILKALGTLGLFFGLYLIHLLIRYYIRRLVTRTETRQNYWSYSRNFFLLVAITLAAALWLEELKTVALVLAGAIAGLLITNKEVFQGFSGRLALATGDHYDIGDRIRINGILGDVINIGLLYTWLLEVDGHDGDNQATGRVVLIPHLWLTQFAVINSTHGHEFLWDEINFHFPVHCDGQQIIDLLIKTAHEVLEEDIKEAARLVPRLGRQYAAKSPPVTPIAYAKLSEGHASHQILVVTLRYVVRARSRRTMHSALTLNMMSVLKDAGLYLLSEEQTPSVETPPRNTLSTQKPVKKSGKSGKPVSNPEPTK